MFFGFSFFKKTLLSFKNTTKNSVCWQLGFRAYIIPYSNKILGQETLGPWDLSCRGMKYIAYIIPLRKREKPIFENHLEIPTFITTGDISNDWDGFVDISYWKEIAFRLKETKCWEKVGKKASNKRFFYLTQAHMRVREIFFNTHILL